MCSSFQWFLNYEILNHQWHGSLYNETKNWEVNQFLKSLTVHVQTCLFFPTCGIPYNFHPFLESSPLERSSVKVLTSANITVNLRNPILSLFSLMSILSSYESMHRLCEKYNRAIDALLRMVRPAIRSHPWV